MHILLTRQLQDSNDLIQKFKSNGFKVSNLPVLEINKLDYNEINKNVQSIKKMSSIPVLVGFGIKSKKDVINISKKTKADGVIIGSALIQKYFDLKMDFNKYLKNLKKFILRL